MSETETVPVGDYEGETHWQNGAGAACDHVDAGAKVSAGKIVLSWRGSQAGAANLTPTGDAGWWSGKLPSGERMEFEVFHRDEVLVLWGIWGHADKKLDLAWFVRLEKVSAVGFPSSP